MSCDKNKCTKKNCLFQHNRILENSVKLIICRLMAVHQKWNFHQFLQIGDAEFCSDLSTLNPLQIFQSRFE